MMRPVFYPYKMHSNSAKVLAKQFGAERVRSNGLFRNNFKRPIINWGNSERPVWMNRWLNQVILNKPEVVKIAANKLLSFQKFSEHGVKCPEWTTDRMFAVDNWMSNDLPFLVRTTLIGKGGEGIHYIPEKTDGLEDLYGKLYVKYFKKKHEYRVHVVHGEIISFAEKKKRKDAEVVDTKIRNFDNGWVFCHEDVVLPACVKEEAIKAVAALGLDFGAVDIGYNVKYNMPCVFEVNSAPGIEGSTVEAYKQAFEKILNG